MGFKSNWQIFNGEILTIDEIKKKYYRAFDYNMVTVLIPDENGGYKFYPSLNFDAKGCNPYYENMGHAGCFHEINKLITRDKLKDYIVSGFDNVLNRHFVAELFAAKGMIAIMRTTNDYFMLTFPAFNEDLERNKRLYQQALGLIDLLHVNLNYGSFSIGGKIISSLEDFEEYYNSMLKKFQGKARNRKK